MSLDNYPGIKIAEPPDRHPIIKSTPFKEGPETANQQPGFAEFYLNPKKSLVLNTSISICCIFF
jgi:hypothetical protein